MSQHRRRRRLTRAPALVAVAALSLLAASLPSVRPGLAARPAGSPRPPATPSQLLPREAPPEGERRYWNASRHGPPAQPPQPGAREQGSQLPVAPPGHRLALA